ncbi:MAG: Glycosyltransferase [Parcubacteria group bacterium GW2011_GWC2_42_12]|nr:MAG: Glycosyltransferase [Parcubacteria group bacterium GW2011_GWC2_42_12]
MKLLILTQKVDSSDAILGFMLGWITELAKRCEKVTVVCLEKGVFSSPLNVKVLSLGKETGQAKIKYLINFYKYIWQERQNYDKVFVHMNPEYVVLGGPLWKILGKKIALWYTHKNVDAKLKIAEKLVDIIFTASTKSFRLKSKKINVMGHGIDIERFVPASEPIKEKIILTVDRISPTKNQLEIIKLFAAIKERVDACQLYIVGAPAYLADEDYFNRIKEYIKDHDLSGQVKLLGAVPNKDTPAIYQQAKVFISFSATGSLDKTVLEAMACNLPVVTTNEAFKNILTVENYSLNFEDAEQKVISFLEQDNKFNYREIVVRDHSLKNLIASIIKELS